MRRIPTMFCVRSLPSNVRSAEHERHVPLQGIADPNYRCRYRADRCADPVISPDPTMNTVDHLYPYQKIDGTRRFLSSLGDANKLVIR